MRFPDFSTKDTLSPRAVRFFRWYLSNHWVVRLQLKLFRVWMKFDKPTGFAAFRIVTNLEYQLFPGRAAHYVAYVRTHPEDYSSVAPEAAEKCKFIMNDYANHIERWLLREGHIDAPLIGSPISVN